MIFLQISSISRFFAIDKNLTNEQAVAIPLKKRATIMIAFHTSAVNPNASLVDDVICVISNDKKYRRR